MPDEDITLDNFCLAHDRQESQSDFSSNDGSIASEFYYRSQDEIQSKTKEAKPAQLYDQYLVSGISESSSAKDWDWNDAMRLQNHLTKQEALVKAKAFNPYNYFGADQLP